MKHGKWVPLDKRLAAALPKDRAFTDLEAAFSAQLDYDAGNPVTVQGYGALWGWSRGKVERFLKRLGASIVYPAGNHTNRNQRGHIVIHEPDISQGHIRLINSNGLGDQQDINRAYGRHKTDIRRGTTINPNPKPNTNTLDYDKLFDWFWKEYPKKGGNKKKVREKIERTVKTRAEGYQLMLALDNYMEQVAEDRRTFPDRQYRNVETFINGWQGYVPEDWKEQWEEYQCEQEAALTATPDTGALPQGEQQNEN